MERNRLRNTLNLFIMSLSYSVVNDLPMLVGWPIFISFNLSPKKQIIIILPRPYEAVNLQKVKAQTKIPDIIS